MPDRQAILKGPPDYPVGAYKIDSLNENEFQSVQFLAVT